MARSKYTHTVHYPEPDYEKPLFSLPPDKREIMLERLSRIYNEDVAEVYIDELERILKVYHAHKPPAMLEKEQDFTPGERFTEEDIILITYGDLMEEEGQASLATLADFCDTYLEGTINTLHILPFFPYSSDRGFSITDFETVDPRIGTWQDIEDMEGRYQLMFDGVINHISSKSRWFQEFLNGSQYYRDFFISYNSPDELSEEERAMIFRPRTSDILSRFMTINGPRYVWTTFSRDQVDLNYPNPNVLMRVIDILLLYVRHGADIIRLDAVTYLWSQPGTRCVHLEQTHEIVKLFRDILNTVAPGVAIITETNVPHHENISYFGNGSDEAQMVYNFALPPLVLHSFYSGDATILTEWARSLKTPSQQTTFFNFLDSHDGVGLMAVKDLLEAEDIALIINRARSHGGLISYKSGEHGEDVPYELNITWYSAINGDDNGDDIAFQVKRFVASRVIALVLQGVPGIYLHGLIGSQNDVNAVVETESNRAINRTVISRCSLDEALLDPFSKTSRINRELGRLLNLRTRIRAFHPNGPQKVLSVSPSVFALLRHTPEGDKPVLALTNVTERVCSLCISLLELQCEDCHWFDIVSHVEWFAEEGKLYITMNPYDILWLTPFNR